MKINQIKYNSSRSIKNNNSSLKSISSIFSAMHIMKNLMKNASLTNSSKYFAVIYNSETLENHDKKTDLYHC